MTIPLNALLFLCGLFFSTEGTANVWYWRDKPTRAIFQAGRMLRAALGVLVILISLFGGL